VGAATHADAAAKPDAAAASLGGIARDAKRRGKGDCTEEKG
jgi:hypothetical protein